MDDRNISRAKIAPNAPGGSSVRHFQYPQAYICDAHSMSRMPWIPLLYCTPEHVWTKAALFLLVKGLRVL